MLLKALAMAAFVGAFTLLGNAAESPSKSLPTKEALDYTIEWRLVTAGKARLTFNLQPGDLSKGYDLKLHVESLGMVSRLFRVNDDYSAVVTPDLCAVSTFMSAHEGSRNRESRVSYDAHKAIYQERDLNKNAVTGHHEVEIPSCVHDLIGGLYELRTMNLEPGKSGHIAISNGKRNVSLKVDGQRRETLKVGSTDYKTIEYEVFAFNNALFQRPGHLNIWLSDDKRHLPVQVQIRLQFTVGTIVFRLDKAE
jgi:hypothetical protein